MNAYDKSESAKMLSYMSEMAKSQFDGLFKEQPVYYSDSLLKEAEGKITAIETSVLGPVGRREKSALRADAAHIAKGNDVLRDYMDMMGRKYDNFDDLAIRPADRYGDPHYIGQVLLRERRALYALRSYLKCADTAPEDMCEKYGVEMTACGKSLANIKRHVTPNRFLQFNVTRAFRVRNKARDDMFYKLMEEEKYSEKNIHLAYNGTITASMPGIIFDGMKIDETVSLGLLFGNAAYLTYDPVKALIYTDLRGAKWKEGQADKAYLGVYKVLYKNPLHLDAYSPSTGGIKKTRETLRPYDALVAHKGYMMGPGRPLKSGELAIYDEAQVTLMYVVEIEAA